MQVPLNPLQRSGTNVNGMKDMLSEIGLIDGPVGDSPSS